MSLVAYGSSDDSDQSDEEEIKQDDKRLKTEDLIEKQVVDEQFSDSDTEGSKRDNGQSTLDGMLKELPTPRASDSGQIVENDALEDIVKPKATQVADVKKPVPKKLRQTVQITIPALPDSDEESDEPARKKPRSGVSTGKSGLTSILPAPVHAAKKETGRILLPYTLTKKTQSTSSSAPAAQKTSNTTSQVSEKSQRLSASLTGYGSDSDDDDESGEPASFFSLDSSVSKTDSALKSKTDSIMKSSDEKQMVGPSLPSVPSIETGIPTVPLPPTVSRTSLNLPAPARHDTELDSYNVTNKHVTVSSSNSEDGSVPIATGPFVDPNAPLTFKGGVSSQKTSYNSNSAMSSSGTSHSTGEGDQNMYYNMPYDDSMQYPESSDVDGFRQDDEFLRLQGKKRRGKEEINLIDVNADDFTDPSEITKHLTEEQTYQSHRKKDNQPSGQQKRKHQIHYLAFQAKERELELKNQWSQNRQTKKQTQAKYGF